MEPNDATLNDIYRQLEQIKVLLGELKPKTRKAQQTISGYIDPGPNHIMDAWNEWRDPKFPSVQGLTPGSPRFKNAHARWREKPDKEYWGLVVRKINESKFCLGDNDRGWVADFEFLVRPDNHHKILEGKFDNCHLTKEVKQERKIIAHTEDGTPVYQTVKHP